MNHQETIRYLLDKGKITQEDLDEAKFMLFTVEKKEDLERLHARYCDLNHDSGECRWYDEEQHDNCWEYPHHKYWKDLFLTFIRSANLVELIVEGVTEESTGSSDDSTSSS